MNSVCETLKVYRISFFIFRILEKILQERPTYHNSSLLKLVARFRCYVIHTFNLPNDLVYLRESALQDPIIEAWLALMENSTTILTCEHVSFSSVKTIIFFTMKYHLLVMSKSFHLLVI